MHSPFSNIQANGANLTGGGTGDSPAQTSYAPFNGGGFGAGFKVANLDTGLAVGIIAGFAGIMFGVAATLLA
jgi:hypothetical protein